LVVFPNKYSPVIFLLYTMFLFLGISASRFSFQALDRIYMRQRRDETEGILLYGAEDAGEMALRWILHNPNLGYRPIGFLDDNPLRWGRIIHGVDVIGGSDQLPIVLADRKVQGVIISSEDEIPAEILAKVVSDCRAKGVWVKTMHLAFEAIE
jgi:UDP-GlcNAc:undecaprenyl-phosphate GlcNAc-1-phosphate transferase